jgi:hypothetical protein
VVSNNPFKSISIFALQTKNGLASPSSVSPGIGG